MVEIVIMLGIIVMVSSVVLVNFPAVTESIFIQRSGQEITGLLRRAQSMALAVRNVRSPDGTVRAPCGVGVHFTNNDAVAVLFGDLPNDILAKCLSADKLYNPGIDATIGTYALEHNLKTQLSAETAIPPPTAVDELNIVFASPDASVNIYGPAPVHYSRALIKVVTSSLSRERTIAVSVTGQISVR